MTSFLRLLALSGAIMLSTTSAAMAAPAAQLVDPNLVFLEDADMPRGFERLPQSDTLSANNGFITAQRFYKNGDETLLQVVFSTPTPERAQEIGGEYIGKLVDEHNGDFREMTTLGDRAVTGYGVDDEGSPYQAVVFQRGPVVAAILWITVEEIDLEAEAVALAARMETRARAAVPR